MFPHGSGCPAVWELDCLQAAECWSAGASGYSCRSVRTLAPWDPTRKLVAVGPYRYVRNPMISGVFIMLLALALIWGSGVVGVWALLFFAVNHTYFILSEEPGLERRFGDSFRRYKANVARWIPRSKPWEG